MKTGLVITVTLRKRDTGYRIWAFQTDNQEWAKTAAQILVNSTTFRNCFAVGTDWEGEIVFECRPEGDQVPRGTSVPPVYVPPVPAPAALPAPGYGQVHGHRQRDAYGPPPAPTGRSYGPAPVPQAPQVHYGQVVNPTYPNQPSFPHRSAYGAPPVPNPRLLGGGK